MDKIIGVMSFRLSPFISKDYLSKEESLTVYEKFKDKLTPTKVEKAVRLLTVDENNEPFGHCLTIQDGEPPTMLMELTEKEYTVCWKWTNAIVEVVGCICGYPEEALIFRIHDTKGE